MTKEVLLKLKLNQYALLVEVIKLSTKQKAKYLDQFTGKESNLSLFREIEYKNLLELSLAIFENTEIKELE